jgi:hypothetical protein
MSNENSIRYGSSCFIENAVGGNRHSGEIFKYFCFKLILLKMLGRQDFNIYAQNKK